MIWRAVFTQPITMDVDDRRRSEKYARWQKSNCIGRYPLIVSALWYGWMGCTKGELAGFAKPARVGWQVLET